MRGFIAGMSLVAAEVGLSQSFWRGAWLRGRGGSWGEPPGRTGAQVEVGVKGLAWE